jgi:hypothetical protein
MGKVIVCYCIESGGTDLQFQPAKQMISVVKCAKIHQCAKNR